MKRYWQRYSAISIMAMLLACLTQRCELPDKEQAAADSGDLIDKVFSNPTIDTFLLGDINGDGAKDMAFLKKPITEGFVDPDEGNADCPGGCNVEISFSSNVPAIHHETSIGGFLMDAGDLNEDGHAEVLYVPDWITSCWGGLFIYAYDGQKWSNPGSVGIYSCNEQDYFQRVRKIDKHSFVLIGQDWNEDQTELKDVPQTFYFQKDAL